MTKINLRQFHLTHDLTFLCYNRHLIFETYQDMKKCYVMTENHTLTFYFLTKTMTRKLFYYKNENEN